MALFVYIYKEFKKYVDLNDDMIQKMSKNCSYFFKDRAIQFVFFNSGVMALCAEKKNPNKILKTKWF